MVMAGAGARMVQAEGVRAEKECATVRADVLEPGVDKVRGEAEENEQVAIPSALVRAS